jgi:hypothetical protein
MFAKLAKWPVFGRRRQGAGLVPAPCNDNRRSRRFAVCAPPRRRPALVCHWHKASTGALECSWSTEPRNAPEQPGMSYMIGRRSSAAVQHRLVLDC